MWYVVVAIVFGALSTICAAIRLLVIDSKVQYGRKEIKINLRSLRGILLAVASLLGCFIVEAALWPLELVGKIYGFWRLKRCYEKYGFLWEQAYDMGLK